MTDRNSTAFYDKGHEVARKAESGDIDGANKEIQAIRAQQHLKPSEYHALLQSIKGANAEDKDQEDRQVAADNKNRNFLQRWFLPDEKAKLPNLIIDDADNTNPIKGYIGRDTAKPAPEKTPEAPPATKPSGEGMALPFNADMANKIFDDTVSPKKSP